MVEGHFDCLQFGIKTYEHSYTSLFVDWVYDFLSRWQILMGRIAESYD